MAWVRLRPGRIAERAGTDAPVPPAAGRFKVPRYWQFVETFPMTVTGKIQKYRLRADGHRVARPPGGRRGEDGLSGNQPCSVIASQGP